MATFIGNNRHPVDQSTGLRFDVENNDGPDADYSRSPHGDGSIALLSSSSLSDYGSDRMKKKTTTMMSRMVAAGWVVGAATLVMVLIMMAARTSSLSTTTTTTEARQYYYTRGGRNNSGIVQPGGRGLVEVTEPIDNRSRLANPRHHQEGRPTLPLPSENDTTRDATVLEESSIPFTLDPTVVSVSDPATGKTVYSNPGGYGYASTKSTTIASGSAIRRIRFRPLDHVVYKSVELKSATDDAQIAVAIMFTNGRLYLGDYLSYYDSTSAPELELLVEEPSSLISLYTVSILDGSRALIASVPYDATSVGPLYATLGFHSSSKVASLEATAYSGTPSFRIDEPISTPPPPPPPPPPLPTLAPSASTPAPTTPPVMTASPTMATLSPTVGPIPIVDTPKDVSLTETVIPFTLDTSIVGTVLDPVSGTTLYSNPGGYGYASTKPTTVATGTSITRIRFRPLDTIVYKSIEVKSVLDDSQVGVVVMFTNGRLYLGQDNYVGDYDANMMPELELAVDAITAAISLYTMDGTARVLIASMPYDVAKAGPLYATLGFHSSSKVASLEAAAYAS